MHGKVQGWQWRHHSEYVLRGWSRRDSDSTDLWRDAVRHRWFHSIVEGKIKQLFTFDDIIFINETKKVSNFFTVYLKSRFAFYQRIDESSKTIYHRWYLDHCKLSSIVDQKISSSVRKSFRLVSTSGKSLSNFFLLRCERLYRPEGGYKR